MLTKKLPKNILNSDPVNIKRCTFQAHICEVRDEEHALSIVEIISLANYGRLLPWCSRIILDDKVTEDKNWCDAGETGVGELLHTCLQSYEKNNRTKLLKNVVIFINRCAQGTFVTDMIQDMTFNAIRKCALNAYHKLYTNIIDQQLISNKSIDIKKITEASTKTKIVVNMHMVNLTLPKQVKIKESPQKNKNKDIEIPNSFLDTSPNKPKYKGMSDLVKSTSI